MSIKAEDVEKLITDFIPESQARAIDLTGTFDHYKVVVVSDSFKELRLIKRHQMINEALKEPLKGPLHALTIEALTTEEYKAQGGKVSTAGPDVQMPGQIKL